MVIMATHLIMSTWAAIQIFDTFAIAEMSTASVGGTDTPSDNNPNVSTLHITYQGPPGGWRIVQDYREKSVLNGFSAAGGLGSFASLLCALLFGTNLFSLLFRKFSIASPYFCQNIYGRNTKVRNPSVYLAFSTVCQASKQRWPKSARASTHSWKQSSEHSKPRKIAVWWRFCSILYLTLS
jgi:hypothetical protein